MVKIFLCNHLSLTISFLWFLFPFLSAHIACPDGSICPNGKQCCSVSPTKFDCCDIWRFILGEIQVAGREHLLGVPSEFGRNHSVKRCNRRSCKGTCCEDFCCEHRNAECCASPHQCCEVGYKCCGGGQWCCAWKTSCSSAFGYCISAAASLSNILKNYKILIVAFVYFVVNCHYFKLQ
ncbi:uncharacterized protein TNCT_659321 [Trichonephila clavata]|uniref:Granulins domain-containing protein n=1 Tax=Trichonephila clavata TaxID=2740835 RepID=A0A8X6FSU5_TRICU|nr:uncharacterized protein TNCT_659321 [Trichonephila clavata]